MFEQQYLDVTLAGLRKLKTQVERAIAQVTDAQLFSTLGAESNSIAVIMKHIAGNMRSRWTDFLTTDGEKPDRDRDREFEPEAGETRENVLAAWEDGWSRMFTSIGSLKPDDLGRTVKVRNESPSVLEAIDRQALHYASHVGQILLLAKHHAGSRWETLSIPRRKSGSGS